MHPPQLAIIADDLTSATDGAVGFAQKGWKTAVLRPGWKLAQPADVLSIDVDSRTQPPEVGTARISEHRTVLAAAARVVKQFDSTLRGHVAPECYAAVRASGRRSLVVVAAFPSAGRTTTNGIQLLHGIPVDQTELRSDPLNSVRSSSLIDLFQNGSNRMSCVRDPEEAAAAVRTSEVVIVDAQSEADLDAIVRRLFENPQLLWCGSTGLLRAISRAGLTRIGSRPITMPRSVRPLVLVGSRSSVSRTQLNVLQAHAAFVLEIDPRSFERTRILNAIARRAAEQPLAISSPAISVDPLMASAALAEIAADLLQQNVVDGIIATGGETAKQLLERSPVRRIDVVAELEPGVPVCVARTETQSFPLLTKAGAFGTDTVLLTAIRMLTA